MAVNRSGIHSAFAVSFADTAARRDDSNCAYTNAGREIGWTDRRSRKAKEIHMGIELKPDVINSGRTCSTEYCSADKASGGEDPEFNLIGSRNDLEAKSALAMRPMLTTHPHSSRTS